jgi:hypothetical protein
MFAPAFVPKPEWRSNPIVLLLVRITVASGKDIVTGETGDSHPARATGVTGRATAATRHAVSLIGVVFSWIGSLENRLGGEPQRCAAGNPLRVIL